MKIWSFDIFVLEVPLGGKVFNPRILWKRKQSVLVKLTDEQGNVGWGECWCFDQSADSLIRFIQTEIKPLILNMTEFSKCSVWKELGSKTCLSGRHGMMAAALSGVDIALHDLISKAERKPLGKVIAPSKRDFIPVYASAGLYRVNDSIEQIKEEFTTLLNAGYTSFKMKFGALSFEDDLKRMEAVREVIGSESNLIVDAVYSLDRNKASKWVPYLKRLNIEAIQAPFPATDWEDMAWMNTECGIKTMVFEAESRYEIFKYLLKEKAIGILQFSPISVGGITASLKLLKLAEDFGVEVSIQCSSTWIAESVALELARVNMSIRHVELHTLHRGLFDQVSSDEYSPNNGFLKLHKRGGIGFNPDERKLIRVNEKLLDL